MLIVHVAEPGTSCDGYSIQPQSELELSRLGVGRANDINTTPNVIIIISVMTGICLLVFALMIATGIWFRQVQSLSPIKNWTPKYLALDNPFIPPPLTAEKSQAINDGKSDQAAGDIDLLLLLEQLLVLIIHKLDQVHDKISIYHR